MGFQALIHVNWRGHCVVRSSDKLTPCNVDLRGDAEDELDHKRDVGNGWKYPIWNDCG